MPTRMGAAGASVEAVTRPVFGCRQCSGRLAVTVAKLLIKIRKVVEALRKGDFACGFVRSFADRAELSHLCLPAQGA